MGSCNVGFEARVNYQRPLGVPSAEGAVACVAFAISAYYAAAVAAVDPCGAS